MPNRAKTHKSSSLVVLEISASDTVSVLEGYSILREAMGADSVEDQQSFWGTVSPATDPAVAPKLVAATLGRDMAGFIVGSYLRNLNIGLIAYSAVREAHRRLGIYTAMRSRLIELFNLEANGGQVSYVMSELEEHSRLYDRYVGEWRAFVLPCAYRQPDAQGLKAKDLKLVLQPIARGDPPGDDEILEIVSEVYKRVYRIVDVENHTTFRRIAASLRDTDTCVRPPVS